VVVGEQRGAGRLGARRDGNHGDGLAPGVEHQGNRALLGWAYVEHE
jgi:hypothetical protein